MSLRLLTALLLLLPTLASAQTEAAPEAAAEAPAEAAAEAPAEAAAEAPAEAAAEAPAEAAEAAAEEAPAEAPKPPPGYQAVSGAGEAQAPIEAPPLVIVSYLVIWLLTLLYLFYLWRRQAALKAEIDALEARLREIDS